MEPRRAEHGPSLPSSPPVLRRAVLPATHTPTNATVTWLRWCVHARGSYTRRHLDSPYPPYSSVRTTRLRTVYTTVRQGRGSPLRQRARRGPPRVIPIRFFRWTRRGPSPRENRDTQRRRIHGRRIGPHGSTLNRASSSIPVSFQSSLGSRGLPLPESAQSGTQRERKREKGRERKREREWREGGRGWRAKAEREEVEELAKEFPSFVRSDPIENESMRSTRVAEVSRAPVAVV